MADCVSEVINETYTNAMWMLKQSYLEGVLELYDWNVVKASKHMELERTHVHRLIREYNLREKLRENR